MSLCACAAALWEISHFLSIYLQLLFFNLFLYLSQLFFVLPWKSVRVSSRRISEPYNCTGSCVAVRVCQRCMVFNCLLRCSYLLSLLDIGARAFISSLIQIFSFSIDILLFYMGMDSIFFFQCSCTFRVDRIWSCCTCCWRACAIVRRTPPNHCGLIYCMVFSRRRIRVSCVFPMFCLFWFTSFIVDPFFHTKPLFVRIFCVGSTLAASGCLKCGPNSNFFR